MSSQDSNFRLIILEAILFAIMIAVGESYLGAFANFLNASPLIIGTIGAMPLVLGAFGQFLALKLNRRITFLRMLYLTVSAEALCFVAIAACYWLIPQPQQITYFLCVIVLYFIVRNLTVPNFNGLLMLMVPAKFRGSFLGRRQKFVFITILIALLTVGVFLKLTEKTEYAPHLFSAIFLLAAACRLTSLYFYTRFDVPAQEYQTRSPFTLLEFTKALQKNNFGKFVTFNAAMNFSTNLVGGFVVVYFLQQLHLSYWAFSILIAIGWFAQFLFVPLWGKLLDQLGGRAVMILSAYGLVLVPIFWLLSTEMFWLCITQAFAGFCWSGHNLAKEDYVFDAVEPKNFIKCQAFQAFYTSIAVLLAVLISGVFQNWAYRSGLPALTNPFVYVFSLSLLLRLAVVYFLSGRIAEVKKFPENHQAHLQFRIVGLNINARASFAYFQPENKSGLSSNQS